MPRPVKWRKVAFIPGVRLYIPVGVAQCNLEENVLKIEELEAIRLKDLEGLEQEECAELMEISRQTFQRILIEARKKIADSLVNGKAVRIEGGNFTSNICPVKCLSCQREWQESFENYRKILEGKYECPSCGSKEVNCAFGRGKRFCGGRCWRHGQSKE
ncbi:MAG: DUF134 domain-containing protein [Firmicutes bacterium]|nr:DUF134 domain-containing protein [Bacillota bacterium]